MSHELPRSSCPLCGKSHDRASGVTVDDPPRPGDLSVCFGCGAALKFSDQLRLEVLSGAEQESLLPEEREVLHKVAHAVRQRRQQ